MEKIIIYGIVFAAFFILFRKIRAFFQKDNVHRCACCSGGVCTGECNCERERRSE